MSCGGRGQGQRWVLGAPCETRAEPPCRWLQWQHEGSALGRQAEAADPHQPKCGVLASCAIHVRAVSGSGAQVRGIWKPAARDGGGARRGLIGPSTEPSSQGGPCRLPRLRELRLPPVSQQPSKAPATSPSRGPAPDRDTAPAPVVFLVQTRSPKNPLLPKSSPQAPPDPSLLLCLGLVPEPPRCTVPRCSNRPDPCQLP